MAEFVLFERSIIQEHTDDSLFVRLTCDRDNELEFFRIMTVTFAESLGLMTPMMIIDFEDGSGDLFNYNRLDTEATYTLFFGRSLEDSTQTEYKIADIQYQNGMLGRSTNIRFQVVFAARAWQQFSAEKKTRGWRRKLYSEVVEEIASEGDFGKVVVEPSQRLQSSIIQSGCTDTLFLKDIASYAAPASADGHYEYAATLDNRFFFRSTGELIADGVEEYQAGNMPLLRLDGQAGDRNRHRSKRENQGVPLNFLGFSGEEDYMRKLSDGASAIETGYYDWENRRYVRGVVHFEEEPVTQLSEWSLLRDDADFISKKMYGGRRGRIENQARNHLSRLALNMQAIHINIEGTHVLHPGKVISVIIPNSVEEAASPYNEMYSGFYMISDVKHQLFLTTSIEYVTQITLTRHGMDTKVLGGYIRSANGRAQF